MKKEYLLFCSHRFSGYYSEYGLENAVDISLDDCEDIETYIWTTGGDILTLLEVFDRHETYLYITEEEYNKINELL